MIVWDRVAEIWAGFGVAILVLVILALATWILGLATRKSRVKPAKPPAEDK